MDRPVLTAFGYTMAAFLLVCSTSLTNLALDHSGVDLGRKVQAYQDTPIGLYRSYSTSAVFYSGTRLIKLEDHVSNDSNENVWSGKYHIPTKSVDQFLEQTDASAPAIVIVKPKDRLAFEKLAAGRQYIDLGRAGEN